MSDEEEEDNAYLDDANYDDYDTYNRDSDLDDFDDGDDGDDDELDDEDEEDGEEAEEEEDDEEEDDEEEEEDDDDDDDERHNDEQDNSKDADVGGGGGGNDGDLGSGVGSGGRYVEPLKTEVTKLNEYDENGMVIEKAQPLHKVLTNLHIRRHSTELGKTSKGKELSRRIMTRLELLQRDPNNSTIKMSLAKQYMALEKWDTAILILEEILSENDTESLETGATTWEMLTRAYMNSAREAERQNDLHRWAGRLGHCSNAYHSALIELDYVEDLAAHMSWSRALVMQNKMDSALSECLNGLKSLHSSGINEQEGHYLSLVALSAYIYKCKYEEALSMATKARKEYKGFGRTHSVSNATLDAVISLLHVLLGGEQRDSEVAEVSSAARMLEKASTPTRMIKASADFIKCDLYYLAYFCLHCAATLRDNLSKDDVGHDVEQSQPGHIGASRMWQGAMAYLALARLHVLAFPASEQGHDLSEKAFVVTNLRTLIMRAQNLAKEAVACTPHNMRLMKTFYDEDELATAWGDLLPPGEDGEPDMFVAKSWSSYIKELFSAHTVEVASQSHLVYAVEEVDRKGATEKDIDRLASLVSQERVESKERYLDGDKYKAGPVSLLSEAEARHNEEEEEEKATEDKVPSASGQETHGEEREQKVGTPPSTPSYSGEEIIKGTVPTTRSLDFSLRTPVAVLAPPLLSSDDAVTAARDFAARGEFSNARECIRTCMVHGASDIVHQHRLKYELGKVLISESVVAARRDMLVSWHSRNKVAARALDDIHEDGDMDYQNAEFLGELAKARAMCGRHKDSMRVLKVLKDDFAKDRTIRSNLVLLSMLLIRTKRYGHAIRYLAKVHKRPPPPYRTWHIDLQIAVAYLHGDGKKQFDYVVDQVTALTATPVPDVWVYASCAYATAGHFDFVVNALSVVLYTEKGEPQLEAVDPVLWLILARYKALVGDQEGALKSARIALQIARRARDGKGGRQTEAAEVAVHEFKDRAALHSLYPAYASMPSPHSESWDAHVYEQMEMWRNMDRDNAFASYTPSRDFSMRRRTEEQGPLEISTPVAFLFTRTLNVRRLSCRKNNETEKQSILGTLEIQVRVVSAEDKICVLAKFRSQSLRDTLSQWLEIAVKTAGLAREQMEVEARAKAEAVVDRFEILTSLEHGDLLVFRKK